jgi:alpha-mannosidase
VEMDGQPQPGVVIKFAAPILAASQVDAQERPASIVHLSHATLIASFEPYQLLTFAIKLAPLTSQFKPPRSQAVVGLPARRSVASKDGDKMLSGSGFDEQARALPREMLPDTISYAAINFHLTSRDGIAQAIVPKGETIPLPQGASKRLYILAASADGDQKTVFRAGNSPVELTIQDWSGFIGQWDDRTWNRKQEQLPPREGAPPDAPPRKRTVLEFTGLKPGFIKQAPVAWFASHRHNAEGANEAYEYSYLFAYSIALPEDARTVTLPDNNKIRILAMTVSDEDSQTVPAQPLYDTLEY